MEECDNCRFYLKSLEERRFAHGYCRRYAPRPGNYLEFYALELLRDIAWSQRAAANIEITPDDTSDINKEATEALQDANWANVEADDWCGEWEAKR